MLCDLKEKRRFVYNNALLNTIVMFRLNFGCLSRLFLHSSEVEGFSLDLKMIMCKENANNKRTKYYLD